MWRAHPKPTIWEERKVKIKTEFVMGRSGDCEDRKEPKGKI